MNQDNPNAELIELRTKAPISTHDLKRKFKENIQFVIDYDESTYKGKVFLTYLSNLDANCKVVFNTPQSKLELLKEYLHSTLLVNFPEMENMAMQVLLEASGKEGFIEFDPWEFINSNTEIIEKWLRCIQSLPVFALWCNDAHRDLVNEYPEDDDTSLAGINFVKLIKHENFPILIADIPYENLCWNKFFFESYVFAGDNLFTYFQEKNNPLFLFAVATEHEESMKNIVGAGLKTLTSLKDSIKEISNVPSVQ